MKSSPAHPASFDSRSSLSYPLLMLRIKYPLVNGRTNRRGLEPAYELCLPHKTLMISHLFLLLLREVEPKLVPPSRSRVDSFRLLTSTIYLYFLFHERCPAGFFSLYLLPPHLILIKNDQL